MPLHIFSTSFLVNRSTKFLPLSLQNTSVLGEGERGAEEGNFSFLMGRKDIIVNEKISPLSQKPFDPSHVTSKKLYFFQSGKINSTRIQNLYSPKA